MIEDRIPLLGGFLVIGGDYKIFMVQDGKATVVNFDSSQLVWGPDKHDFPPEPEADEPIVVKDGEKA